MAAVKKVICPTLKTECLEDGTIVDGELQSCRFWVRITGKDPSTGKDLDQGDCAIAWMPVLLLENSQMQRQTGAAVESFRNVLHKDITDAIEQRASGAPKLKVINPEE